MSTSAKCAHGQSLDKHCKACEKVFGADERNRAKIVSLEARVAKLEKERNRLFDALSAAPVPVSNPSDSYIEHWESWHNGQRRRAMFIPPAKPFKLRDQFTDEEWAAREVHGGK